MPPTNSDPGAVRSLFRVLACFPALASVFLFTILVANLQPKEITTQHVWDILLTLFLGVLFSVAAIRGRVPRWLLRLIPHSWAWERSDDKSKN